MSIAPRIRAEKRSGALATLQVGESVPQQHPSRTLLVAIEFFNVFEKLRQSAEHRIFDWSLPSRAFQARFPPDRKTYFPIEVCCYTNRFQVATTPAGNKKRAYILTLQAGVSVIDKKHALYSSEKLREPLRR